MGDKAVQKSTREASGGLTRGGLEAMAIKRGGLPGVRACDPFDHVRNPPTKLKSALEPPLSIPLAFFCWSLGFVLHQSTLQLLTIAGLVSSLPSLIYYNDNPPCHSLLFGSPFSVRYL